MILWGRQTDIQLCWTLVLRGWIASNLLLISDINLVTALESKSLFFEMPACTVSFCVYVCVCARVRTLCVAVSAVFSSSSFLTSLQSLGIGASPNSLQPTFVLCLLQAARSNRSYRFVSMNREYRNCVGQKLSLTLDKMVMGRNGGILFIGERVYLLAIWSIKGYLN